MTKKKLVIVLIIIILILIGIIIFLLLDNKKLDTNNEDYKIEDKIDTPVDLEDRKDIVIEEDKTLIKETNNDKKSSTTKQNNTNKNSSSNKTTQPVQPTYTCPDGYELKGTQCIMSYEATLGCPDGKQEFSDGNISGCIKLGEGYYTEEDTCPKGYGMLRVISLGADDKYQCVPVSQKVLVCIDGYNLEGSMCKKVISATKK